jgi:hypothetical protein
MKRRFSRLCLDKERLDELRFKLEALQRQAGLAPKVLENWADTVENSAYGLEKDLRPG